MRFRIPTTVEQDKQRTDTVPRRDRPTRLDQLDQTTSTFGREWSVTVHRALLGVVGAFDSSTLAQGAQLSADVTNVPSYNI